MDAIAMMALLAGSFVSVGLGLALIASWIVMRSRYASTREAREQLFALQASTEVCNLAADREYRDVAPWTQAEEDAYQRTRAREREILASKRGDLLQAACWAELSEVERG